MSHIHQVKISALENGEPGFGLRTLIRGIAILGLELVFWERITASKNIEDIF